MWRVASLSLNEATISQPPLTAMLATAMEDISHDLVTEYNLKVSDISAQSLRRVPFIGRSSEGQGQLYRDICRWR